MAAISQKMGKLEGYSSLKKAEIVSDLQSTPLEKGEQVNIIGYSGGGYVTLQVAMKLVESGQKVDNVVVFGTPKQKLLRVNENSRIVKKLKEKGVNVIFPECEHDKFSSQDEMIEQREQYKIIEWMEEQNIR